MIGGAIMKFLIKKMRELVGMSQEQFAKELGTSVVSINRWENGKSLPNPMAQQQLYSFCEKHNVEMPSADMVYDVLYKRCSPRKRMKELTALL